MGVSGMVVCMEGWVEASQWSMGFKTSRETWNNAPRFSFSHLNPLHDDHPFGGQIHVDPGDGDILVAH